jgi:ABC-type polysaccharide/polyol phosphate export permease
MKAGTASHQAGFWMLLGWYDILSRYRSTVLGVVWIVIINGLTVFAIGYVYSALFQIPLVRYFPYLVTGYIFWLFISTTLVEMSGCLSSYRFILHSHPVRPISVLLRVFTRNFVILLHNIPIVFVVLLLFGETPGPVSLIFVAGLFINIVILIAGSGLLAFLCARFSDVQMIITAAMGVLFLVTPIIWSPEILTERAYIAYLNPLTHMLDILRKPLLGEMPTQENYLVTISAMLVLISGFFVVYRAFHKKYVFWL